MKKTIIYFGFLFSFLGKAQTDSLVATPDIYEGSKEFGLVVAPFMSSTSEYGPLKMRMGLQFKKQKGEHKFRSGLFISGGTWTPTLNNNLEILQVFDSSVVFRAWDKRSSAIDLRVGFEKLRRNAATPTIIYRWGGDLVFGIQQTKNQYKHMQQTFPKNVGNLSGNAFTFYPVPLNASANTYYADGIRNSNYLKTGIYFFSGATIVGKFMSLDLQLGAEVDCAFYLNDSYYKDADVVIPKADKALFNFRLVILECGLHFRIGKGTWGSVGL